MAGGLTVLVCDDQWKTIAQPLAGWSRVNATKKWCEVGDGEIEVPGTDELIAALDTPDSRIVVQLDGQVWTSGPVEKPGNQLWTPGDGTGLITVHFATCEAFLSERIVYPNPAVAATAQTTDAAYTVTATNAETVARNLVNLNAGPGALAARQIPGLTLGGVAGVGTNIDLTSRFDTLTDVLRTVASAGGGFTWRVRQAGTGLIFECLATADRSGWVRFSRRLGTVREFSTDPETPTCTAAIVGGSGEGTTRAISERLNTPALTAGYRRVERFINQGSSSTTELDAAGDLALLEGAASVGLVAKVVDSPQLRYGVDYELGDTVAIDVAAGLAIYDRVTSVSLEATPNGGVVVSPVIGNGEYLARKFVEVEIREIRRRLGRLERG